MQTIKYPHSKLKRHHGNYLRLVDEFFRSIYNLNHYLVLEEKCIVIEIHDVNPYMMFNPSDFEPSYRVKNIDGDVEFISTFEIFETFYGYLPDIVPYVEFELYAYDGSADIYFMRNTPKNSKGYFERFNLRDLYYQYESRKEQYTVTRRVNSWGDNGVHNNQFVL